MFGPSRVYDLRRSLSRRHPVDPPLQHDPHSSSVRLPVPHGNAGPGGGGTGPVDSLARLGMTGVPHDSQEDAIDTGAGVRWRGKCPDPSIYMGYM